MSKVNAKKVGAKEIAEVVVAASPFTKSVVRKIKTGYRAIGTLENGFKVVREGPCKDTARSEIETVGLAIAEHSAHVKSMAAASRRIARAAKKEIKD